MGDVNLKPCPFCGGDPLVWVTRNGTQVQCARCGASVKYLRVDGEYRNISNAKRWTQANAVNKWNRRATDG